MTRIDKQDELGIISNSNLSASELIFPPSELSFPSSELIFPSLEPIYPSSQTIQFQATAKTRPTKTMMRSCAYVALSWKPCPKHCRWTQSERPHRRTRTSASCTQQSAQGKNVRKLPRSHHTQKYMMNSPQRQG